jgi:hypothetical protein
MPKSRNKVVTADRTRGKATALSRLLHGIQLPYALLTDDGWEAIGGKQLGSYLNIQHFKCAVQSFVRFGVLLYPPDASTDRGVVHPAKQRTDRSQRQATVLPGKPHRKISRFRPVDRVSQRPVHIKPVMGGHARDQLLASPLIFGRTVHTSTFPPVIRLRTQLIFYFL